MDEQEEQIMQLLCSSDVLNIELGLQLARSLGKQAILSTLATLSGFSPDSTSALQSKHIEQLHTTIYLNFQCGKYAKLPALVRICANAQQLFLHSNRFTELPDMFEHFTQVFRIQLHDNLFTEFPLPLLRAIGVKELFLNRNRLRSIPPDIKQLQQLEILALGGNQLETLPIELLELPRLKKVFLTDNPLKWEQMPKELADRLRKPA